MENINWTTLIIGGFFGALIGIPFAYFVNLTTPKLGYWVSKKSIESKGKSINKIKKTYEMVKYYKANPHYLTQEIVSNIGILLSSFCCVFSLFFLAGFVGLLIEMHVFSNDIFFSSDNAKLFHIIAMVLLVIILLDGYIYLFIFGDLFYIKSCIMVFDTYEKNVLKMISEFENKVLSQKE